MIVTLCGSTRFRDEFTRAQREFAVRGITPIGLAWQPNEHISGEVKESEKELLDLVHYQKILMADAIFVVGTGYFGKSTCREIIWASMNGKMILSQFTNQNLIDDWDWHANRLVNFRLTAPGGSEIDIVGKAHMRLREIFNEPSYAKESDVNREIKNFAEKSALMQAKQDRG